jgi:CYTH domain-containing protein
MTDHDFLVHPEHWRDRVQKTLAEADKVKEAQARHRLLKIAREYERLAVRAEESKAALGASATD